MSANSPIDRVNRIIMISGVSDPTWWMSWKSTRNHTCWLVRHCAKALDLNCYNPSGIWRKCGARLALRQSIESFFKLCNLLVEYVVIWSQVNGYREIVGNALMCEVTAGYPLGLCCGLRAIHLGVLDNEWDTSNPDSSKTLALYKSFTCLFTYLGTGIHRHQTLPRSHM